MGKVGTFFKKRVAPFFLAGAIALGIVSFTACNPEVDPPKPPVKTTQELAQEFLSSYTYVFGLTTSTVQTTDEVQVNQAKTAIAGLTGEVKTYLEEQGKGTTFLNSLSSKIEELKAQLNYQEAISNFKTTFAEVLALKTSDVNRENYLQVETAVNTAISAYNTLKAQHPNAEAELAGDMQKLTSLSGTVAGIKAEIAKEAEELALKQELVDLSFDFHDAIEDKLVKEIGSFYKNLEVLDLLAFDVYQESGASVSTLKFVAKINSSDGERILTLSAPLDKGYALGTNLETIEDQVNYYKGLKEIGEAFSNTQRTNWSTSFESEKKYTPESGDATGLAWELWNLNKLNGDLKTLKDQGWTLSKDNILLDYYVKSEAGKFVVKGIIKLTKNNEEKFVNISYLIAQNISNGLTDSDYLARIFNGEEDKLFLTSSTVTGLTSNMSTFLKAFEIVMQTMADLENNGVQQTSASAEELASGIVYLTQVYAAFENGEITEDQKNLALLAFQDGYIIEFNNTQTKTQGMGMSL